MLMRKLTRAALATTGVVAILAGTASAQDKVKLTFLFDNAPSTVAMSEALAAAFEATHPNIDIETESRPGGADGDNLIKTRLATGEMADVFLYNSGSLFQAINPTQNLVDLTNEPFQANVLDSFKTVVTGTDGGAVSFHLVDILPITSIQRDFGPCEGDIAPREVHVGQPRVHVGRDLTVLWVRAQHTT